jgi:hypothetical protein
MCYDALKLTAQALLRVTILKICLPPPPHSHDVYARPIVTTCLYTSALLSAELGSCLYPSSELVMSAPTRA